MITFKRPAVMQETFERNRTGATDVLFGQICRATPDEARGLSMMLNPLERAEMALFRYSRVHTREHGRAIASTCTRESLFKAGGYAGASLYDRVESKGDTWGATAIFARKVVSLAG